MLSTASKYHRKKDKTEKEKIKKLGRKHNAELGVDFLNIDKMVKKIIFEQSSEGNVEILTDIYGKRILGRETSSIKPATAYLAPSWI